MTAGCLNSFLVGLVLQCRAKTSVIIVSIIYNTVSVLKQHSERLARNIKEYSQFLKSATNALIITILVSVTISSGTYEQCIYAHVDNDETLLN